MTQEFHTRTDTDVDVTAIDAEFIEPPDGPTHRRNPSRYETVLYVADTEDARRIETELESLLSGAEWATVEYRHTLAEYGGPEYRDDPGYYHPSHGLRTPPRVEFVGGFDVRAVASYAVDGTEYDEEVTLTIPRPDGEYWGRHSVVGTPEGIALDGDGVLIAGVVVKEPLDRIPRSGIDIADYPDGREAGQTVIEIGTEPEAKSQRERLAALEQASGVTGKGKRGVAHRIDELEDRIKALEGE